MACIDLLNSHGNPVKWSLQIDSLLFSPWAHYCQSTHWDLVVRAMFFNLYVLVQLALIGPRFTCCMYDSQDWSREDPVKQPVGERVPFRLRIKSWPNWLFGYQTGVMSGAMAFYPSAPPDRPAFFSPLKLWSSNSQPAATAVWTATIKTRGQAFSQLLELQNRKGLRLWLEAFVR